MEAWILRYIKHRPGFGAPRPIVILHVTAGGEETELEVFQLGSVRPDLADLVRNEIGKGHTRLILDLCCIGLIDATVIGQIAGAFVHARDSGAAMVLAMLNPRVRSPFEITGLDTVIPIFDSIPAALGHFTY